MGYLDGYLAVALFMLLGLILIVVGLGISHLLSRHGKSPEKDMTYECGVDPIGEAKHRYNVRFYVFAVIFLIFDVEALFLLPWALQIRKLGPMGLIEAFVFIIILLAGLVYAWRQGALEWV